MRVIDVAEIFPSTETPMTARFSASWPEAIYWSIAFAMLAAFLVTLVLMQFDARTLDGHTSVWTKPLKFELSLAIHAATIALACSLLSASHRHGSVMLLVALAFLAACIVEMGYIIFQGALGQQSHFKVDTPFHSFMYSVMAFAAIIIIGAAGAVGLAAFADKECAATPTLRIAIGLGFIGGTILTLITAFTIGGRMSPYVEGIPEFSARMILTGWSQTSGDLRVSHFLATHMIQAVPFIGLLLGGLTTNRVAVMGVVGCAALWTLLTISEYRTALAGKPSAIATAIR